MMPDFLFPGVARGITLVMMRLDAWLVNFETSKIDPATEKIQSFEKTKKASSNYAPPVKAYALGVILEDMQKYD